MYKRADFVQKQMPYMADDYRRVTRRTKTLLQEKKATIYTVQQQFFFVLKMKNMNTCIFFLLNGLKYIEKFTIFVYFTYSHTVDTFKLTTTKNH